MCAVGFAAFLALTLSLTAVVPTVAYRLPWLTGSSAGYVYALVSAMACFLASLPLITLSLLRA